MSLGPTTSDLTIGRAYPAGQPLKSSPAIGFLRPPPLAWRGSLRPDGLPRLRPATTLAASLANRMSAGPSPRALMAANPEAPSRSHGRRRVLSTSQSNSKQALQMTENAIKPVVAVIGLGSMGFGMATSLLRAGFAVTGCDVAPKRSPASSTAGGTRRRDAGGGGERRRHRRSAWSSTPRRPRRCCSARTAPPRPWRRARVRLLRHHGPGRRPAARRRSWKRPAGIYLDAPIRAARQRAAQGELTILASGQRGRLRQGAAGARRDGRQALRTRRRRRARAPRSR